MDTQIRLKVHEIYQILTSNKINPSDYSLLNGEAGIILFLYQYDCFFGTNSGIVQRIETIFSTVNKAKNINFSHYSGLAGVVWLYHFLEKKKIFDPKENLVESVYPYLYKSSINHVNSNNHDFLHGSIGEIIWLINRISADELVLFLTSLNKGSQKRGGYIFWQTEDENFFKVYLGMAHGLPAIVSFLTKCYAANINRETCIELINGSLKFILQCKFNIKINSKYPQTFIIGRGSPPVNSKLGWCWGDLGIAAAFWEAGKILKNDLWKQESFEIMLHSASRRDLIEARVKDASFCHGTAGIAHIFNRFFWETGVIEFKEAADFWIQETLNKAVYSDGLAGFKSYNGDNDMDWIKDHSLIKGISGTGLSLLSHLTNEEPEWDSCFLLS